MSSVSARARLALKPQHSANGLDCAHEFARPSHAPEDVKSYKQDKRPSHKTPECLVMDCPAARNAKTRKLKTRLDCPKSVQLHTISENMMGRNEPGRMAIIEEKLRRPRLCPRTKVACASAASTLTRWALNMSMPPSWRRTSCRCAPNTNMSWMFLSLPCKSGDKDWQTTPFLPAALEVNSRGANRHIKLNPSMFAPAAKSNEHDDKANRSRGYAALAPRRQPHTSGGTTPTTKGQRPRSLEQVPLERTRF